MSGTYGGRDLGYRSASMRSLIVISALGTGILANTGALLFGAAQLSLLKRIAAGQTPSPGAAEANDLWQSLVALMQFAVFLGTVVVWLVWIHRAYANLDALGARDTKYSPGWAVGWYVVPFLNFMRP